MKTTFKIIAMLAAVLGMASCVETDEPATPVVREIIYAVGTEESRTTLHSEMEWDELLDRFCDYAQAGDEVAFYNLGAQPDRIASKGVTTPKDATTFSTSNRQEMKDWMKLMEKEGKTVNVRYDEGSGTWHGTAYATAPNPQPAAAGDGHTGVITAVPMPAVAQPSFQMLVWALVTDNDSTLILMREGMVLTADMELGDGLAEGDTVTLQGTVNIMEDTDGNEVYLLDISVQRISVVGTWHYLWRSETVMPYGGDYLLSTTFTFPDEGSAPVVLELRDDGTITCRHGQQQQDGTWSLGDDGRICCDLFDGGGCWNICWLSGSTLVLGREEESTGSDVHYSQMMFEAVANSK